MIPTSLASLTARHVVSAGVPRDEMSSYRRGAAAAPAAVRRALASPSANWATEAGRLLE